MQKSVIAALVLSVLMALSVSSSAADASDRLESGSIQAYDGKLGLVRLFGQDFVLSERARQQLEDYLALDPARTLMDLTVRFEPKKKDGKPYIESVVIPQDDV